MVVEIPVVGGTEGHRLWERSRVNGREAPRVTADVDCSGPVRRTDRQPKRRVIFAPVVKAAVGPVARIDVYVSVGSLQKEVVGQDPLDVASRYRSCGPGRGQPVHDKSVITSGDVTQETEVIPP